MKSLSKYFKVALCFMAFALCSFMFAFTPTYTAVQAAEMAIENYKVAINALKMPTEEVNYEKGDKFRIPFLKIDLSLGFWFYVLALFFLVGTVNCANLTDGIDGLATSVNMVVGGFYTFLAYSLFENGLLLLGGAMTAASLSFLLFNYHPARVFMGDTGSLFFGALAGGCAFLCGNPLLLLLCGIVYYVEGFSVVLQVLWFKISGGKRLFRMAPFHHHLEKCGWPEEKIVFTMTLVSLLGAIVAAFAV